MDRLTSAVREQRDGCDGFLALQPRFAPHELAELLPAGVEHAVEGREGGLGGERETEQHRQPHHTGDK